jgi:hypothetical protein
MALPAAAHRAIQAERKVMRNAGARANRVRVAGVKVLQATDAEGQSYVLALGDKQPSRAYVLRRDKKTGALVCDCFMARWKGTGRAPGPAPARPRSSPPSRSAP